MASFVFLIGVRPDPEGVVRFKKLLKREVVYEVYAVSFDIF
jgi:hypothetical protein